MKIHMSGATPHDPANQGLLYLYSLVSSVTAIMGWLPDLLGIATTVSALVLIWMNIKGRRLKNKWLRVDTKLKEKNLEEEK